MDSGEYEADNFEKLDFLIKLFSVCVQPVMSLVYETGTVMSVLCCPVTVLVMILSVCETAC